ncbi:hypothetical protein GSI_02993 [Ganoderma sinense ZZ0214-1]|uniref:Uncharacterized protein n=1 Tax=Ganoderma sinense ZZ0214-1 TaxID=1077348 RepID=A0A2G8SNA3_9APHY|nr:hypothetical protein GSI_02993 [Ganoderma sinense ZZ0214-1]
MDPFLPSGFSPYYPPDDPEDVLPLEEDALVWLDSLTIVPNASPDTGGISSDAQHLNPLSFASQSPEVHASNTDSDSNDNDNDNKYASSDEESLGSSSEGHRGKKARISLDPCQPLTVKGKPRARVYVACCEW